MPIAGNTYTLFPCPGTNVLSPIRTGGKGLPLAKTARPPDHVYASSAVHSECDVGFEYGKTIGRSLTRAMASMTARLKARATVLTPMITVGRRASIAAAKS